MATILMPIPSRDFDPTEAAVSWSVLTRLGHRVLFATPDARPGTADDLMLTGRGLPLLGWLLRADRRGRRAYARMRRDPGFLAPITWSHAETQPFDGLLLCGGHRARGMRAYLESPVLQSIVADAFAADRPVAAICHGVLLVARSRDQTGRSVLFGRKTTALTWNLERTASRIGRLIRFWDPAYYRTYPDAPGQAAGHMSVQQEVTRALANPADFHDVPPGAPHHRAKTGGLRRDRCNDPRPAFVVRDANYVSARWPGDTHTFARTFAELLDDAGGQHNVIET